MGARLVVGVAGGLELEGRVLDVKVTGQTPLGWSSAWGVPVQEAGVVDHHVGGDGRQVRGDGPDVQVVYVPDMGRLEQVGPDVGQVDRFGGRFQQDRAPRPSGAATRPAT